jgi:hypothetical protein
MEDILTYLSKWLSGGPFGIILGLFGLGGIGIAFSVAAKRLREVKFQKEVTDAASVSGRESKDLSDNMRSNTAAMDAIVEKCCKPGIKVPAVVKVGVAFDVVTEGISTGCPILADRRWILGYTLQKGATSVKLTSAGPRTIDIIVSDVWYTATILVKE